MLTQKTHCSKYEDMKQNTNVKSDIKYHKRHSGHIQFHDVVQGSGSTEGASHWDGLTKMNFRHGLC